MDPMEDVQMNQQGNSAHQYQCRQQPSLPPTAPAFTPQPRNDQQHYDPVHDANQYYQGNNYSTPSSRPSYQTPQSMPHWQPSSYMPMPIPHWNNYADSQRPNVHGPETPQYTPSRTFMDVPWNEMRGFDSFGGYYSGPLGIGASSELNGGSSNPLTTGPGMPPQMRGYGLHGGHPDPWQRNQYSRGPPITPNNPRRAHRNDESSAERAAHHFHQAMPSSENHRASSNTARRSHRSRGLPIPENWSANSRRLSAGSNLGGEGISDEEDDELLEADYRRNAELLFDPGEEEQRAMAAMRGALAMGKKVTTRDFLANLEVVPIDQIPESERSCSICYETIGTENPEGLTEKAVRMPKCKHLFGDICIKKWCQDSDTCPYCRDKLPSELSVKRGLTAEYRIAQRERMRYIERARRANGLSWTGTPPTNSAEPTPSRIRDTALEIHRAREEVESYIPAGEPWGLPWGSSRLSGNDSSERPSDRRRPTRGGRLSANRPNHYQGRPTSVGSSRFVASYQNTLPRPQVITNTPAHITFGNHVSSHAPRRSITPGLTRQNSNPDSARASTYDFPSPDSEEAASPPVAVGSGVSTRQLENAFRRSLDQFTTPRNDDWVGSPSRHSPPSSRTHTLGSPFQGVTSPLRQHPTSDGTSPSEQPEDNSIGNGPPFPRWSR